MTDQMIPFSEKEKGLLAKIALGNSAEIIGRHFARILQELESEIFDQFRHVNLMKDTESGKNTLVMLNLKLVILEEIESKLLVQISEGEIAKGDLKNLEESKNGSRF